VANNVPSNIGGGILLSDVANNNTVRANKTDGDEIGLFAQFGSTGNLLQANQAHNNGADDLFDNNTGLPCANA
jgi:hypothetical protein